MALHQVILFFTIIFLWYLMVNTEDSMTNREEYFSPGKPRHLFLHQPLRSTRKISQRAFKDMDLFTARGYGKRGAGCFGSTCGKRMPEFSGARLYGKRNIDMNQLKCNKKETPIMFEEHRVYPAVVFRECLKVVSNKKYITSLFVNCGDMERHFKITDDEFNNRQFKSDEDVFTD